MRWIRRFNPLSGIGQRNLPAVENDCKRWYIASICSSAVSGGANASFTASNYLHDFSLHRLSVSGRVDFRIVRGFSVNARGSFARVKDQIFLPLEDIPEEEILLARRAIGTEFQYSFNFGFTFRFGSIFNNVVNPRRGV